ncbi:BolA family protein [Rhodocyclus tenuis]|uniref:BolA family protein n=1 Tax=Rhodocyclus tenuis TaxID=1066 RepID=UPI0019053166|nr:BolA family protein [Rhodocyclus tenuis]MBK1679854.1 BolA family transcriptional regulator [Rhodocyclus tenuis]
MSAADGNLEAQLRARLAALEPTLIELVDDSARHAGHAGASKGAHYKLLIASPRFAGLSPLARHRLVIDTVGDLMHGPLHALSIKTVISDAV